MLPTAACKNINNLKLWCNIICIPHRPLFCKSKNTEVFAAKVQFAANTSDVLSSLQWPRVQVWPVALCWLLFCSCYCIKANIFPAYYISVTSCIPTKTGEVGTTVEKMRPPAGMENMNSCQLPITLSPKKSGMLWRKVSDTSVSVWVKQTYKYIHKI